MDEQRPKDQPEDPPTDEANEPTQDRDVGPDGQPIGPDNIREGRVGGVMGGPNPSHGEGQGG